MPDIQFDDIELAALYDAFNPRDLTGDFAFYLPSIVAADAVLDVGCGTGSLLHLARETGHTGRLCGLDPAEGMLARARRRTDVEWVHGDLSSARWEREFDLIVMTGHAFQVLLEDDELRVALSAIRRALTPEGRFAFETRNPQARGWERWTPDNAWEITTDDGTFIRSWNDAEPPDGEFVSFSTTFTSPSWDQPRRSRSTLRFLGADRLSEFLTEAGLAVDEQYGSWDRQPLTATSPEIITFAKRVSE